MSKKQKPEIVVKQKGKIVHRIDVSNWSQERRQRKLTELKEHHGAEAQVSLRGQLNEGG